MTGLNGPSTGWAVRVPADLAWHATPADEVLARLESRPDGLTIVEAQQRLAEHGPNALTRQRGPSAWQVVNALVGFVQEHRAGKAIQALAQLVSEPARVRRDGRWTQVGADALVPVSGYPLADAASPSRSPSACSGWPGGTRSCASYPRWRRRAPRPWRAPTRPAR